MEKIAWTEFIDEAQDAEEETCLNLTRNGFESVPKPKEVEVPSVKEDTLKEAVQHTSVVVSPSKESIWSKIEIGAK